MKIPFTNIEILTSNKSSNEEKEVKSMDVYGDSINYSQQYPILTRKFDGEKTPGELGVIFNSIPDYNAIRLRAYDAELRTDLVRIITDRFFKWTVGSGLKLQSEINKELLRSSGIDENFIDLQENIEARFSIYSKSKFSDYSRMTNLHEKAMEVKRTSFVGGDCLVVCRIEKEGVNVQVVDGNHIKNPSDYSEFSKVKDRGNYLKHGIEFNKRGEHIGFYVCTLHLDNQESFEYIPAYGSNTKIKLAWLVYGEKNRVDHVRGVSCIASILEKVNKLDRYTEAAVSKAEQAANIAYTIEHDNTSTGESPVEKVLSQKAKLIGNIPDGYSLADGLANRITESTSNQTFNMPIGSSLKSFGTNIETDYAGFESAIFNKLCASVGVPAEVALQMYNSNYSASRAAINAWGYIIELSREKIADDFYRPFYKIWLLNEILQNKIEAPGYVKGLLKDDFMVTDSYSQCRFIGKNMPHIDPLKEVKAIRSMLGDMTKGESPLINYEQATEMLNAGEWSENYSKYLEEDKKIIKLKTENNGTV